MQRPILQAYGLTYSIQTEQDATGWRAMVLIPCRRQDGRLCWHITVSSPIPGLHASESDAYQVAHLFAVVNASRDRLALAELNWCYRAGLITGSAG